MKKMGDVSWDLVHLLEKSMRMTTQAIFKGKIDVRSNQDLNDINGSLFSETKEKNPLAALNAFNWSYTLDTSKHSGDSLILLSDFDSILVNMKVREFKKNPRSSPMVLLPYTTINVQNKCGRLLDRPSQDLYLIKTPNNDRQRS